LWGDYSYNQPSYDHLQSVFATLFPASVPGPIPPQPTDEPQVPTPTPITQTIAVVTESVQLFRPDGTQLELKTGPALQLDWSLDGAWIAYASPNRAIWIFIESL